MEIAIFGQDFENIARLVGKEDVVRYYDGCTPARF